MKRIKINEISSEKNLNIGMELDYKFIQLKLNNAMRKLAYCFIHKLVYLDFPYLYLGLFFFQ